MAQDIRRTLDRRAAAVVDRDESAYLAALDPAAASLRAAERREFANLAQVPLRSWEYRLTGLDRTSAGRATAEVELRYRFDGYDDAPVKAAERLDLVRRDGHWYVAAEHPGSGGGRQFWEQGEVTVVRGARSLVLGADQDEQRLRAWRTPPTARCRRRTGPGRAGGRGAWWSWCPPRSTPWVRCSALRRPGTGASRP